MALILVVDDCPFSRRVLDRVLARVGHELLSTGDPLEALRVVTERRPDLVTLDYEMPQMTGAAVYTQLWHALRDACPPVLFVSGRSPDDVLAAVPAGAPPAAVLVKPVKDSELTAAVSRALSTSRRDR